MDSSFQMGCFVVAEFLLTIASRGPSAIAEPLVRVVVTLAYMRNAVCRVCDDGRKDDFKEDDEKYDGNGDGSSDA